MPPQNGANAAAAAAIASASVIGRFQGLEQFDKRTLSFASPQTTQYQPFNLTRPLESITIVAKYRLTVTVGAYTSVSPEALPNLLQNVRLEGQHATFGNIVPISISGASAYTSPYLTQNGVGNETYVSKSGGALTLSARPTCPQTSGFDGTVATHDVISIWSIPLTPYFGIGSTAKRWANSFLFMPGDWGDRLRLSLTWGDASALGNPTGATTAFTAFQSATGSPEVSVHLNYSILGPFQNAGPQGIVIRNEQLLTQFTAAATASIIMQLQKRITSNLTIKSGTVTGTGSTAGVTTFTTLSDLILERTNIQVDNKMIRQATINMAERARLDRMFSTFPAEGYLNLSFVDGQNPLLAYRGDGLPAGSLFNLVSDILTTSANTRLAVTQEQIIGGPFPALRP